MFTGFASLKLQELRVLYSAYQFQYSNCLKVLLKYNYIIRILMFFVRYGLDKKSFIMYNKDTDISAIIH